MREFEIYIDGASKGNPGPSGIGVVICRDKETIKNISSFIGIATNNIAEYTALLYGLREALILKAEVIKIKTDSQLLARQLNKVYKVKHPNIVGLYNQALNLLAAFKEVSIKNIPREENTGADKLATQAIKKELKKPAYRQAGGFF
ncbi:MAG: ribonuclease HI family protein [Candidatus Omnitrophota bacterium]|jgi:ribonuclease HI|nr:ribonuclease HI family protein [Candidatus Omnitrophota bacterium]